jgi:crotonobetainyl-CoA:carnitine CoA-transferase CaiB-like acyl-CoA transferase
VQYRRAPPTLGQHTEELLADMLGYDEQQIASLAARKII